MGARKILARSGGDGVEAEITKLSEKGAGDFAEKAAVATRVLAPTESAKREWFTQITKPKERLALTKLREAMGGFQASGQEMLTAFTADPYFNLLEEIARSPREQTRINYDDPWLRRFAATLFPAECTPEILQRAKALTEHPGNLPALTLKILRGAQQETERCLKIRATPLRDLPTSPGPQP